MSNNSERNQLETLSGNYRNKVQTFTESYFNNRPPLGEVNVSHKAFSKVERVKRSGILLFSMYLNDSCLLIICNVLNCHYLMRF